MKKTWLNDPKSWSYDKEIRDKIDQHIGQEEMYPEPNDEEMDILDYIIAAGY